MKNRMNTMVFMKSMAMMKAVMMITKIMMIMIKMNLLMKMLLSMVVMFSCGLWIPGVFIVLPWLQECTSCIILLNKTQNLNEDNILVMN